MTTKGESIKNKTEKKQKEREKMGDRKGDDKSEAANEDMLANKAGFDNVTRQIGSNSEENSKEMKDIRESIQNLGSMLSLELATFKVEMNNRFEAFDRGIEAQGRDIIDIQERVVENEERERRAEGDSRLFAQAAKETTGKSN